MEPIVELKNLRKEYKEFTLDSISLSIPQGYIIGLIGLNGAGKTTAIKLIMNMIKADDGEVTVFGKSYNENEKEIKNGIGYVGEDQYFYNDRTVAWTGRFTGQFYSNWDINIFNSLLNDFSISGTKKVNELSKGMRVKLALAVALSHDPKLIILDEPTAGLDPLVRRDVLDLLQKVTMSDDTRSVLISSHITDDISRIADSVTYLVNGRIALSGDKDDLLSNWKRVHYRSGSLSSSVTSGFMQIEENVFGSSGIINNFRQLSDSFEEGISRDDIRIENIGLDDILISFVRRGV